MRLTCGNHALRCPEVPGRVRAVVPAKGQATRASGPSGGDRSGPRRTGQFGPHILRRPWPGKNGLGARPPTESVPRVRLSFPPHLNLSASADQQICVPHGRDRQCRSGVGGPGGEHAASSNDGEPEHATAGLAVWRSAALTGSAGNRVLLGLAVQVGDPGLHDLIVNVGVHHGLPVTQGIFSRQPRPAARQPSVTGPTPLLSACRHLVT